MSAPKCITAALAVLRAERAPLAARLDALDLAIENISRVWGLNGAPRARPITLVRRKSARPAPVDASAAADRRALLLTAIRKSEVGLTIAELKKACPKITSKERSNALTTLRLAGSICRKGNAWVQVA